MDINTPWLNSLLDSWLNEDLGRGALTNCALTGQYGSAYWNTKQNGIFCGGALATKLFKRLNSSVHVNLLVKDGENLTVGQRLLEVKGPTETLASVERTALNLAMRLSGIATATKALV